MPRKVNGAESLGTCFDILFLDPLNMGQSSKHGRVFDIARSADGVVVIGDWEVPKGVDLEHYPSTDVRRSKFLASSSLEFRTELLTEVQVDAGFEGVFDFSASATSKTVSSATREQERSLMLSYLLRKFHTVSLSLDRPSVLIPLLNQQFREVVRSLPLVEDADEDGPYRAFIDRFGTHFAARLTLGGMAFETISVSREVAIESKEQENKISSQASVVIEAFNSGVKATDAKAQASATDRQQSIERTDIQFVGGKGGLELCDSFIAEVDADPVPIANGSKLGSLSDVLTHEFFPDDADIAVKRSNFEAALDHYIATVGRPVSDCIFFGGLNHFHYRSAGEFNGTAPGKHENFSLYLDGIHLTANRGNAGPPVRLVVEPVLSPNLKGQLVLFGQSSPVRLRVMDHNGVSKGWIVRGKEGFIKMDPPTVLCTLSSSSSDKSTVWFLDLCGSRQPLDSPRAVVDGDFIRISQPPEDPYANFGTWVLTVAPKHSEGKSSGAFSKLFCYQSAVFDPELSKKFNFGWRFSPTR